MRLLIVIFMSLLAACSSTSESSQLKDEISYTFFNSELPKLFGICEEYLFNNGPVIQLLNDEGYNKSASPSFTVGGGYVKNLEDDKILAVSSFKIKEQACSLSFIYTGNFGNSLIRIKQILSEKGYLADNTKPGFLGLYKNINYKNTDKPRNNFWLNAGLTKEYNTNIVIVNIMSQ